MNARYLLIFTASILALICANTARADGAYQRTDDRRKAMVWNNDPQTGDIASWSGQRDEEGYASGEGTLSWFKTEKSLLTGSNIGWHKKVPISKYTGTMVHGKFAGEVETVDHGKMYHANFVDGHRKGQWARGPAPAEGSEVAETKKSEAAPKQSQTEADEDHFGPGEKASEDVVVNKSAAQTEKETAERSEELLKAAKKARESVEPEPPAEGPASTDRDQKSAISEKRIAKNSQSASDEASTDEPQESRTPITKKGALAPGAVRAIEQPGRVAKKTEVEAPKEQTKPKISSAAQKEEKATAKAESVEPAKLKTESTQTKVEPESPAEGPVTEMKKNIPPSAAETKPEGTPVDDSIRTLTGPPSSLHVNPQAAATAPPKTEEKTQQPPAAPTSAAPKLTAVEAMDAADIEARTNGYDLGDYQLPKADFNATNGMWSVTYVRRDADKSGKQLSVTVEDKNGKAEVKK